MADETNDPYQSLKDAWHLYQQMSEGFASSHAHAMFNQETIDDGWSDLSSRIDTTKSDLFELAGPSDTHKERRHNRHERSTIAAIGESLDETYTALSNFSEAEVNYLKLEKATKHEMDEGGQGDLTGLDMARSQVSRYRDNLASARSGLSLRIENLADESGSGLFSGSD